MINQKISVRQFKIFVILFSIGTTILVIPGIMAQVVQQDAWLAAGIGTVFGLAVASLYIAVGRLFPAKTLVEMNEILLGKWFGIPVSLVFILFSLYGAARTSVLCWDFLNCTSPYRNSARGSPYHFCLHFSDGDSLGH